MQFPFRLAVLSTLCAIPFALQAAEVGIRGAVDIGLTLSHTKDGTTLTETTGNYVGSEVTLFGEEELRPGTSAGFVLTTGFNADDGAFDSEEPRMFNHESQLYLRGDWGQVGMGRMSSFATGLGTQSWFVDFDAFEAAYNDAGLQGTQQSVFSRFSNSIYYASPEVAGFRLGLFYSLTGEWSDTEAEHFQDNERYWNAALRWDRGPASAMLSFEGNERGNADDMDDGLVIKAAASYDAGFAKFVGGYAHAQHQIGYAYATWVANWDNYFLNDDVTKKEGITSDAAWLGVHVPLADHAELNLQYQYLDGENKDTREDFKRHVLAAGVYKYFSARTMLYTVLSHSEGRGALSESADPDSNATTLHVGISHFF